MLEAAMLKARSMCIQTPTNRRHRADGGVLNPVGDRQKASLQDMIYTFCPLPSAFRRKRINAKICFLSFKMLNFSFVVKNGFLTSM
jgi:hypothetical protein